jgi:hypothetical protein
MRTKIKITKTQVRKAIKAAEFDPTTPVMQEIISAAEPAYIEGKIREYLAIARDNRSDTTSYDEIMDAIIRYAVIGKAINLQGR